MKTSLMFVAGMMLASVGCDVPPGQEGQERETAPPVEGPAKKAEGGATASSAPGVEGIKQAEVISTEYDACRQPLFQVESNIPVIPNVYYEHVRISPGTWTHVGLRSRRFKWWCGNSTEWTTCPSGTHSVWVWWNGSWLDGSILWYCTREL